MAQMQFPKSTPDLNNPLIQPTRRTSRRQSRNINPQQVMQMDFQIANPFLITDADQQNYLPPHLHRQISQMQYISSKSIKEIKFDDYTHEQYQTSGQNQNGLNCLNNVIHPVQNQITDNKNTFNTIKTDNTRSTGNPRRRSNFNKNLQMMQAMARKQQQKYTLLKQGNRENKNKCKTHAVKFQLPNQYQVMNQRSPMSINIDDDQISLQINGYFDGEQRILDDFNMFDEGAHLNDQHFMDDYYSCHDDGDSAMDEQFNNYLG